MDASQGPGATPLQANDSLFFLFVAPFSRSLSVLYVFSIYGCEVCVLPLGSRVESAKLALPAAMLTNFVAAMEGEEANSSFAQFVTVSTLLQCLTGESARGS